MSAKQTAINDIKESLKEENKCFIAFHRVLNPIMDSLVRQQLDEQAKLNKR